MVASVRKRLVYANNSNDIAGNNMAGVEISIFIGKVL